MPPITPPLAKKKTATSAQKTRKKQDILVHQGAAPHRQTPPIRPLAPATLAYPDKLIDGKGPEAIGLAEQNRPDLALVDIRLSGPMDGIKVAQLLLERFGVPSIFLSGICDDQTIERALAVSSLGFLQKPFLPSQVFDAIDRALADILPLNG